MKPEKIFKRYDVRGRYPEELDEEFAERIGRAVGQLLVEDDRFNTRATVGKDNKQSSEPLRKKLVDGLKKSGINVLYAGTGPTDFTAFNGMENNCVSIQVTSSHMPLNFNGFKFMYPEGNGFVNKDLNRIEENFRKQDFTRGKGTTRKLTESRENYLQEIKDYVDRFQEVEERKIVVDTLGGASTDFLPKILEQLGFKTVNIAEEKEEDGPYYNPPNPKPEILEDTALRVEKENAEIGIATDMDADRVAVYYNGKWLSGDELFLIFTQMIDGEVVASIDSSKTLEEYSEKVHYTRVGDPFVIDKTLEEKASLSGEPNGHYCFPDFVPYNSGTLAALLITVTDIDPLLDNIPEIHTEKTSLEVKNKEEVMKKTKKEIKNRYKTVSDKDGVKYNTENSSVLIRPSGSSPVIRIKAEAENRDKADKTVEKAKKIIKKHTKH